MAKNPRPGHQPLAAAYRTPVQIRRMNQAGLGLHRMFAALGSRLAPGMKGEQIENWCRAWFRREGLEPVMEGYEGFPAAISLNPQATAAHGLPSGVVLEPGMVLTLDTAVARGGFCADASWTWALPPVSPAIRRLLNAAWQATCLSCKAVLATRSPRAMGAVCTGVARSHGVELIPRFAGHGLGREIHEAPRFDHLGQMEGTDFSLSGICLSLEPVLTLGQGLVHQAADGSWVCSDGQPCACFEHNIYLGHHPGEGYCLTLPDQGLLDRTEVPVL